MRFLSGMQFFPALKTGVLLAAVCLCVQGQTAPGAAAPVVPIPIEAKGLPPRAAPTDYQGQAQLGNLTIAADFAEHSVPTEEGVLSTEDFVTVEMAWYGPPGARAKIAADDFSLRINGQKTPLPSRQYSLVFASLRDTEWELSKKVADTRAKTSVGGGGQDESTFGEPATTPKPSFEMKRGMVQRVRKAALPEGDRLLPQAGLIFFQYGGKVKNIRSVELIYEGPAGKATMALHP